MKRATICASVAILASCAGPPERPPTGFQSSLPAVELPLEATSNETSNYAAQPWSCRVSWNFGYTDKTFQGEGSSEEGAAAAAKDRCLSETIIDDQKHYCRATPIGRRCERTDIRPPRVGPRLELCAPGRPPRGARRSRTYDVDHRNSRTGSARAVTFAVPGDATRVRTWCKVWDDQGTVWCRWTPYRAEGCDYWFNAARREVRRADDRWEIKMVFNNESDDRNRKVRVYYIVTR